MKALNSVCFKKSLTRHQYVVPTAGGAEEGKKILNIRKTQKKNSKIKKKSKQYRVVVFVSTRLYLKGELIDRCQDRNS